MLPYPTAQDVKPAEKIEEMEERDRLAYLKHLESVEEWKIWESEAMWPEADQVRPLIYAPFPGISPIRQA